MAKTSVSETGWVAAGKDGGSDFVRERAPPTQSAAVASSTATKAITTREFFLVGGAGFGFGLLTAANC